MSDQGKISRRSFLKISGSGAAGLGLGLSGRASESTPRIREFRELGTTGLRISDVGCGCINLFNAGVLRYAFDGGVNHFDTAEGYLNTNSERMLGQALQGIRDKVIITTKLQIRTPADLQRDAFVRRLEDCLRRLRTDYVDIVLVHAIDEPGRLDHEEVQAGFRKMKEQGKARHIGFSTHAPALMLTKAIEDGPWEVVLMTYNHLESAQAEPLIVKARDKGVGLIAMKILAGGMQGRLKPLVNDRTHYAQAAIRWVMGNPKVDACTITMSTYSHVDEYIAASGQPLRRSDEAVLARYREAAGPLYCRVSCRECLAVCPKGVAVNEVLRYAMYYEHYGMERNAMELYGGLEPARRPSACDGCSAPCVSACPHGLQVRSRLLESRAILSA